MRYFHFIGIDKQSIEKINGQEWTNSIIRCHQNQDELRSFLRLPNDNVVFLDIDSNSKPENIKRITRLKQLTNRIIILSKDTEFAYNAIKVGVHDYVLKSNFIQDVLHLCKQPDNTISQNEKVCKRVIIHCADAVHYLFTNEIIRCHAESNYTKIVLKEKTILIAKTLKKVEDLLPPGSFYRVHRSHVVNLDHVKMIRFEKGGIVITSDNYNLPIARNRKASFINKIQSTSN